MTRVVGIASSLSLLVGDDGACACFLTLLVLPSGVCLFFAGGLKTNKTFANYKRRKGVESATCFSFFF